MLRHINGDSGAQPVNLAPLRRHHSGVRGQVVLDADDKGQKLLDLGADTQVILTPPPCIFYREED